MPKPPRTTTDPLGKKLLQVLREKGRQDDLRYLAECFGVAWQSTYDWINHGRLSKDRYARLVEWSGRSLDWWFDAPMAQPTAHLPVGEVPATYHAKPEKAPTLDEALIAIGLAIAALAPERRDELADNLRVWALHGGKDINRMAVAEVLSDSRDLPSKLTGT